MFIFAKPDGSNFNLDYNGPISAFDSRGKEIAHIEENENPAEFSQWSITIELTDTNGNMVNCTLLQRALASAWAAISLCERLVVEWDRGMVRWGEGN